MATTEHDDASAQLSSRACLRGSDFRPAWPLRNPHLQSILASSGLRRMLALRRASPIERDAATHVLDCGEGVRLQGAHTAQRVRPIAHGLVVLLHGWEGSTRSGYLINTGAHLLAAGFDVFRLNLRDHGDTHALNRGLFHSCRIDEVVGALAAIEREFGARMPLAVAGFSLGGNFALRLALRAPQAGIALRYAIAICPVIDPAAGLFGLESAPWFYERYFLHKWRASLRRKQALFPDVEWFTGRELAGNLRELTRALVLRHTDFGSLERYLDGYSVAGDRLKALGIPATILTAIDDPVIPVAAFQKLDLAPQVELDFAEHGGHCGFIGDFAQRGFIEEYITRRIEHHLVGAIVQPAEGGTAMAQA